MPLAVNTSSAGSMPSGGGLTPDAGGDAELASAKTPDGSTQPTAGQGDTGWMPVFQIGSGEDGVPTTARGLVSGFQATSSIGSQVGSAATSATQAALSANTPATPAGSATGDTGTSGGAAGSTASGDQGNPDDRGAGDGPVNPPAGGSPAPKATSKAQRDANNAEAQREFPGYVGADG